jgi:hypothetical protein
MIAIPGSTNWGSWGTSGSLAISQAASLLSNQKQLLVNEERNLLK